jgi:hypothetical protein
MVLQAEVAVPARARVAFLAMTPIRSMSSMAAPSDVVASCEKDEGDALKRQRR